MCHWITTQEFRIRMKYARNFRFLLYVAVIRTVACRGLVVTRATALLDAPYQILLLSSGVGLWWSLWLVIRCLWRHSMTSYSRLQTNVLAKFVDTTCIFRDAGVAVGQMSSKTLRAMETYKKNIVTNCVCFYWSTMLTSKIITEIIENHSSFSRCPNSCNNFISSRLW